MEVADAFKRRVLSHTGGDAQLMFQGDRAA
jgi:hypothetical protein